MKYLDLLEKSDSLVCFGMDPVLEKIPIKEQSPEKKIVKFYTDILDAKPKIGAAKPNYAYFAQYGFPGLRALKKLIAVCKGQKIPTILDAKRADIGTTSEAYAREVFEFWKADAVTVQPYLGNDSVEPYFKYCEKGKGIYLLVRTSNVGAKDFQDLKTDGEPFYRKIAAKVVEWHKPGMGAVVGATKPEELKEIHSFFEATGKKIPLLIPGVGTQGGSGKEVSEIIKKNRLHRINSSSAISYAYQNEGTDDYVSSAAKAIEKLNTEIDLK